VITNLLMLVSICLSPAELYTQSNQSYGGGDFLQAIEGYEEVAKSVMNADVYYNLGNSYFKVKKIGKAIINYRRASCTRHQSSRLSSLCSVPFWYLCSSSTEGRHFCMG